MNPAWTLLLSVRKLFGFLIPGFVWLILLSAWRPAAVEQLIHRVEGIWSHGGFVVPVAIVASYFLGAISSVLAFRFLELFGDTVDSLLSRLHSGWSLTAIRVVSRRLHILGTTTIAQDLALLEQAAPADDFSGKIASQHGNLRWGLWKMYVLERAPALAKEALDTEGEINFMAGMFSPTVGVAIWAFTNWTALGGSILTLIALYLALRFQNLRHHERWFTAQAYAVARQLSAERGTAERSAAALDKSGQRAPGPGARS